MLNLCYIIVVCLLDLTLNTAKPMMDSVHMSPGVDTKPVATQMLPSCYIHAKHILMIKSFSIKTWFNRVWVNSAQMKDLFFNLSPVTLFIKSWYICLFVIHK